MKRIDRKILIFLLSLRLNGRAFLTTVALDEARRAGRMPLGLSLSELFLSLLSYLCLYLSLSLSLPCSPSVSLSLAVCLLLSLFSSLSLFISLSLCLSFSFSLSLSLLPPLPHSPFVSLSFLVPPSSLALFISLFSPFIHSFLSVPIKPVSSCTPASGVGSAIPPLPPEGERDLKSPRNDPVTTLHYCGTSRPLLDDPTLVTARGISGQASRPAPHDVAGMRSCYRKEIALWNSYIDDEPRFFFFFSALQHDKECCLTILQFLEIGFMD